MRFAKLLLLGLCYLATLPAFAVFPHPTFLLVHGALLTSDSWIAVQSKLQNAGYNVVTVDVPGRADDGIPARDVSLDLAAEKICQVAALQVNSVILVGHSQGGAVINQALAHCAYKIKSLVYVAAVSPLPGESTFDDLSQTDNDNFEKCTLFDKDESEYKVNYTGPLKEMFMADASEQQVDRAIHTMVPEPTALGDATLAFPLDTFKAKPKFYIETLNDKIISITTQRKIEKKINPSDVYTIASSHSPFLAHADVLARDLINIANRVKE